MIFDEGLVKLWTVCAFIQRDRSYQLSIYTDRLQLLRPRVNSNRSWATRTQESTRPISTSGFRLMWKQLSSAALQTPLSLMRSVTRVVTWTHELRGTSTPRNAI